MEYLIKNCIESDIGDSSRGVDWIEDPQQAEFFGVYRYYEEFNHHELVGDFETLEQAKECLLENGVVSKEISMMNNNPDMEYQIKACKEVDDALGGKLVEWVYDQSEAEFYGVYGRKQGESEWTWIADFPQRKAAEEFVLQSKAGKPVSEKDDDGDLAGMHLTSPRPS